MTPKFILLLAGTCITLMAKAQNVGIGTSTPKARLHVADSGVVFTGPLLVDLNTPFAPPVSGAGTRLMWYPQKAAFRAGNVNYNEWNKDSVGFYSFATGLNVMAKGNASSSTGYGTVASGQYASSAGVYSVASGSAAFSTGSFTTASGNAATSMGYQTTARGEDAVSMGSNTAANGTISTSMGDNTTANGYSATSMGNNTVANGSGAASMGMYTYANGMAATSMGGFTVARSDYSLVVGSYNDTSGLDRLFEVGNGTTQFARKNALTVLRNGNTGIGTAVPTGPLSFSNVVGNKIVLYGNGAAVHYGIGIQGAALQLYADVPGSNILFGSGSSGTFAERMRIINAGADGLELSGRIKLKNGTGSLNDPPGIWFYKADNSDQLGFFGTRDLQNIGFFGGPAGWGFVYDALNSRVGIGTVTPSQALQVVGNILASGTITPSDERYKKNITVISHPLEKIQRLNGVTYHYRSADFPSMKFSDQQQVGLIAQDVEKVFPQLVFEDDKGYKAVDYVKLVPLLVEGIKTQQQQIDQQQKKQQEQQQEIDQLKHQVKLLLHQ